MTRRDRAAFELAIVRCREQDQAKAQFVDEILAERAWIKVARFCAYSCQMHSLRLWPWEKPPCEDGRRSPEGERLLAKLLAAKISRYHPDPLAALAEATKA